MNALPTLTYRKRANLSQAEVQLIVDFLPKAALLVDRRDEQILLANPKAADLTGYSQNELQGMLLKNLFPDVEGENALGSETAISLAKRSGEKVDVQITSTDLPPGYQWVLLFLETAYQEGETWQENRFDEQIPLLLQLSSTSNDKQDPAMELEQVLRAASIVTGAHLLAIYRAEAGKPLLKRSTFLGEEDSLPSQITLHDLVSMQTAQWWTPQQRANNSLHRAARHARLAFVASAPLGQASALMGLVVIADQRNLPADSILGMIQLLANRLTHIIQAQTRLWNLQRIVREQSERLDEAALIQDTVQDGIIRAHPDLTILDLNSAAELMLGYASHEVTGEPIENILVGVENLNQAFVNASHIQKLYTLGQVGIFRRDGRPFLAQLRLLPILSNQELKSWAVLIEDLSQEEQFRIRAQQLEQRALLGEVTAVFAHEVRNPINNISTGLQWLGMNLPADHPNQEMLARLQQDCDRLADLMKSVLAFGRPKEYKMEALDLEPYLRRMLERWHPRLARNQIEYSLQVETETPPILGDFRALEQVFNNLIINAMQAMEHGGKLTINVRPAPVELGAERVEITVADSGPGIPDEIRDRLFEPFFTTKTGGTGLGLPITKQIVTAHRGTLQVISIPGGTAFQIVLPAAPKD